MMVIPVKSRVPPSPYSVSLTIRYVYIYILGSTVGVLSIRVWISWQWFYLGKFTLSIIHNIRSGDMFFSLTRSTPSGPIVTYSLGDLELDAIRDLHPWKLNAFFQRSSVITIRILYTFRRLLPWRCPAFSQFHAARVYT